MADQPTPRPPQPVAVLASRSLTNRPQLPRRQSRFTEDMTEDYTPAHSVYEHEHEASPSLVSTAITREYPASREYPSHREFRPLELIARGMNGCTHGAACVILVAIMTEFLSQWEGFWLQQMSGQAVALLVFLGLDTLLDILSLVRLPKSWPAWTLAIRLMNGIVYIAVFLVYVAHGRVFPPGFTFWAMSPGFAGPVVYMFLWLLGVWNLLHIVLRRHRLGTRLRSLVSRLRRSTRSPGLGSRRILTPETTSRPPRSPTWRRWIRVGDHDPLAGPNDIEINAQSIGSQTTVAPSPSISLRERPNEIKRHDSFTAATCTASSHSGSKHEEGGLTRAEKEKGQDMEKELEGGLSPPPRLKM